MALADPSMILFLAGVIIVLGFAVNYLFLRTGIADPLFLLLFGLFLGSYLRVVEPAALVPLAPMFSQVALLIILVEGGMDTNLYEALKGGVHAILLAVVCFLLSMFAAALVAVRLLGWDLLYGLLLGAIVGNPTPLVVFSVVKRLGLRERTATVLRLEATVAEILAIVTALALLESLATPQPLPSAIIRDAISRFSVGGMLGIIAGVLWYFVLDRVRELPFSYMLTLAAAFIVFSVAESLGGSGPVSALLFGLTLGNEESVAYILRHEREILRFDETMRAFHSEISFFIRAFFFVYLGAICSVPQPDVIVHGVLISLALLAARTVSVVACTVRTHLWADAAVMSLMLPRGLAAAVLATHVLSFADRFPGGMQDALIISELTFVVIFATILMCTVGTCLFLRRSRSEDR
ncbi:MAG: cation:proton antiporter domain-containing protein [Candidatus Alkanophagales archaeon]